MENRTRGIFWFLQTKKKFNIVFLKVKIDYKKTIKKFNVAFLNVKIDYISVHVLLYDRLPR